MKTETYFVAGLVVKSIPEIDGCYRCCFDDPTNIETDPDNKVGCSRNNELVDLPPCSETSTIFMIANIEEVSSEDY